MQQSVAGVVVLYRPSSETLDNVLSYLRQVQVLYAVDNTEQPDESLAKRLESFDGVEYLPNHQNLGVAAALNLAARKALEGGYEWLLTMDQDSVATGGMVDTLLSCASEPGVGRVGLVSPFHVQVGGAKREPAGRCHQVLTPMTSGSLVSLSAHTAVGPFLEELFIDEVDNEFCLRLRVAGYSVLEAGEARLSHRVGTVRFHRFPVPMYTTNHPPVRRYYMTRNRLYVGRMYRHSFPSYYRWQRGQIVKDAVKIALYEDRKLEKLRMMFSGMRDGLRGRLGVHASRQH